MLISQRSEPRAVSGRRRPTITRRRSASTPAPHTGERVVVIGATVGQGHEGAARELARRLAATGTEVVVHDYLDALPRPVARILRDLYAPTVRYAPWLFDHIFSRLEHHGSIRSISDWVCRLAEDDVARWCSGADVVVSTYPLAGQTLGRLRRHVPLPSTTVTYLTDPAAHATWCDHDVDVHLTVTGATAIDAARYGVRARVAGPLCDPAFAEQVSGDGLPAALGVPAGVPVVLLAAGSLGMGDITATVDAVHHHPDAVVVVLCGRNAALRRQLASKQRVVALGWRDDVPALMAAADVLVHNAGGLSLTEALVAGLPAITYLPIPGHGRANAAVLARNGIAAWPQTPGELAAAIARIHADRERAPRPWPVGADPADVILRLLPDRGPAVADVS